MKVTFLEDVPNIARVGQTRVVADGFARNFLLPRKLAVVADSPAAAAVQGQIKKKLKVREIEEAEMKELAAKIEGTALIIRAKVGENEKLYGSVTGADIAVSLTEAIGREIDKKTVELAEPVRQTGAYKITIRLGHEITAGINVKVVSEEATEEQIAATTERVEKPEAKKAEKPPKKRKEKTAEAAEGTEGAEAPKAEEPAEKPEKPAKKRKEKAPETAESTKVAETAEKPAKKRKEKAPEAVETAKVAEPTEAAEKPASKPKAKSTRKAKAEETAAPESEEKAAGE